MATDATPTRGRPRSVEADQAIFAATRRLLDEAGYHGLTVEGVAAEAGVAKTTIYRRYANKALLVLDAMDQSARDAPVALPDTGTFRGDLLAVAQLVREEIAPSSPSSVGAALLGEASQDVVVAERLRDFADFRFEQAARCTSARRRAASCAPTPIGASSPSCSSAGSSTPRSSAVAGPTTPPSSTPSTSWSAACSHAERNVRARAPG